MPDIEHFGPISGSKSTNAMEYQAFNRYITSAIDTRTMVNTQKAFYQPISRLTLWNSSCTGAFKCKESPLTGCLNNNSEA
jgi:hypothetical protein